MDPHELLQRASTVADRRWPGAEVCGLRRLPGGVSSLTYATELRRPGEDPLSTVLKVAPTGLEPVKNRDVLRQSRVIRLLGRQGFPVPDVLFEDDDLPPLFAMELVRGESYEPLLDVAAAPPSAEVVGQRARAAARALAQLQLLSPDQIGVGDEPVLSLREELDRWALLLSTVPDDICLGHDELHARLGESVPEAVAPGLVHGDYRLANMLFDGGRLTAVIDWEIWSVGDPRVDLAWLLMHTDPPHYFRHERPPHDVEAGRGMPSATALLEEYRTVCPVEVSNLDWFLAYGAYKTASTIAVFVKRNRRLAQPDPVITVGGESLRQVVRRGLEIMERRS